MTLPDNLFDGPAAPRPGAAPARRCSHPRQNRRTDAEGIQSCGACLHIFDPDRQRMGRLNRKRGNAKELAAAKRMGTTRTGHHGGKDDYRVRGLFAFQNKSMVTSRFPGWMTRELDGVRAAWPDLEPVLHVEESPGAGFRPRRLYIVDEKTWLALHGPEAA